MSTINKIKTIHTEYSVSLHFRDVVINRHPAWLLHTTIIISNILIPPQSLKRNLTKNNIIHKYNGLNVLYYIICINVK